MIKQLINWLTDKEELIKISSKEVAIALPKINYKSLNPARYWYMDDKFESTDIKSFKNILARDFTNWRIYHKDYDCDNFAFKLYTNLKSRYPRLTIGVALNSRHAFNVFVDKFGKAWYIEPQNDKVFPNLTGQYKPISLIIL